MKRNLVVLSILSVVVAGCGSESESQSMASQPAEKAAAAAVKANPIERMAHAVGGGKPGAAVDLKYEFQSKPDVGKPVQLELVFVPSSGVSAMDISVAGMDGISLTGALTASFNDVKAGEPYKHQVTLLPQTAGVFYVTVTATTHIGSATMGRTFSVPFVVGSVQPQEKAVVAPQKDSTGQPVQPMPAVETTNPKS